MGKTPSRECDMKQITRDIEMNLSALINQAEITIHANDERVHLAIKVSDLLSECIILPLTDEQVRSLIESGRELSDTRTTRFNEILEKLGE